MRKLFIVLVLLIFVSTSHAIMRKFSDYTERWYQGYDDTTKGMTNEPTNNYFGINKIAPTCELDIDGTVSANTMNCTNLTADNLEQDLDATGFDITAIQDINASGTITANEFIGDLTGDITGTANNAITSNYSLDSDKLDGEDSTYFTNASNLASGTLPDARITGEYTFTTLNLTDLLVTNIEADFDMTGFDITSIEDINAGGTITANEFMGNGSGLTGIYTAPDNIVSVISGATEITGEIYSTWASADAYIQTQSPSTTDRWGIKITGTNTEDIVVRSWIRILGESSTTILTGNITSAVTYIGTNLFEAIVNNCIITNLTIGTGKTLLAVNSFIEGGTLSATSYFMGANTSILDGDYSNSAVTELFYGYVLGGTFGSKLKGQNLYIVQVKSAISISGGLFYDCRLTSGTYNSGNYVMYGGLLDVNITLASGTTSYLDNVSVGYTGQTITLTGGTLNTYGIAKNLTVTVTSGTWNNEGVKYDNAVSGLTATDTQAAIDEIISGFGGLPNTVVTINFSSAVTLNNASNVFYGDGSNLTDLNADQLSSGTLPDARLTGEYTITKLNTQDIAMTGWLSYDGDNEGIRIDSSGRVGIGSGASPYSTLELNNTPDDSNCSFIIASAASREVNIFFRDGGTSRWAINKTTGDDFTIANYYGGAHDVIKITDTTDVIDLNGDVDATGQTVTAGTFTDGTAIITGGDISGTTLDVTVAEIDDLYATNLEADMDGTGFEIKATTFNAVGSVYQINGTDINTGGTLSNVGYLDQANTFTLANTFTGIDNGANAITVNSLEIVGVDGEVNASVIEDKFLRNDANDTMSGTLTATGFSGDGSALTALSATQLTTGTVPDARLTGEYTVTTLNTTYINDSNIVGQVIMYAGATTNIPTRYLNCDGTSYVTANYTALYAVIGYTFGGSGANFNVPNMQGVFARGAGSQTINTRSKGGGSLGDTNEDRSQGHIHKVIRRDGYDPGGWGFGSLSGTGSVNMASGLAGTPTYDLLAKTLETDGSNGAPRDGTTTEPSSLDLNYIIKY